MRNATAQRSTARAEFALLETGTDYEVRNWNTVFRMLRQANICSKDQVPDDPTTIPGVGAALAPLVRRLCEVSEWYWECFVAPGGRRL